MCGRIHGYAVLSFQQISEAVTDPNFTDEKNRLRWVGMSEFLNLWVLIHNVKINKYMWMCEAPTQGTTVSMNQLFFQKKGHLKLMSLSRENN